MKSLLAGAAMFAALTSPCLAQTATPELWHDIIESITAARDCGLINYDQMVAASLNLDAELFGSNGFPTDAYKRSAMSGADAGHTDALLPGFCANYPQGRLNFIVRASNNDFN